MKCTGEITGNMSINNNEQDKMVHEEYDLNKDVLLDQVIDWTEKIRMFVFKTEKIICHDAEVKKLNSVKYFYQIFLINIFNFIN